MSSRELLLLSGGLDSAALAVMRRPSDALTINYGQVCATSERTAAQMVCRLLDINHHTLAVDCSAVGAGLLASKEAAPGHAGVEGDHGAASEFWPFRNQLLVTLAASVAFRLGIERIVLGCVSTDRERHVDGSPGFVDALGAVLKMQEGGIELVAPAADLTTQDLIDRSSAPMSLLGWTHSCHTSNMACGWCPGCSKRSLVLDDVAPLP
ncbi:MAG: 7-cyano-7-deazaguanine synthase [Acidimicrobiales bacterium]